MQTKTISKIIRAKMDEWLETIKNESLKKDLEKHLLVTGGSIASMLLHEDVNDFDVYIQDRNTLLSLVHYYASNSGITILDGANREEYVMDVESKYGLQDDINKLHGQWVVALRNLTPERVRLFIPGSRGGLKVNEDINEGYVTKFFSPNAISLSDKLQIVVRFFGTPEEIHENFDFVHATNYWTYKDGLVLNIEALTSLLTRQLKYRGSKYPVTSIIRAKKFLLRKWGMNAGEMLKIMFQISELNLSDIDTLEDQLIGVDVAYFDTLITALRNKPDGVQLSSTYLGELIDKIFDGDN